MNERRPSRHQLCDRSLDGGKMTRVAVALAMLGALSSACHSTGADAQSATPLDALHVLPVEPDTQQRPGMVLLQWRGPLEAFGESFAVVDESGYRGLVRTERQSTVDCDHCPGPLLDARLMSGAGPSAYGAVAVGPVKGPLPHARVKRSARSKEPGPEWATSLSVDLDGDGRWDYDEMQRCGHYARSGCAGKACDMICSVVTRVGESPDPRGMDCQSFLPDVEDCVNQ
jgi:hypothetical protein